MTQQILINATKARKNFFNLLSLIADQDKEILITKKGSSPVVMKRAHYKKVSTKIIKENLSLIKNLSGSLKTSLPYQEKEMEIASSQFVSEFKEKYGRK